MKRVLPAILGLVVLLGIGLVVGPSFMDWNKYKPQIIEQAKSAAGYDVAIEGDLSLSLIPTPQLKIEGLTVKAPRGKEPNLLTMKQANVSVKFFPLISGAVVVDTVRLVNPDIKLEVLADGSNSWMSDKFLTDKEAPSDNGAGGDVQPSKQTKVSLDKVIIENGRVSYLDRRSGKEQLAENINLDLKADSLQGPFTAGGSLLYGGKTMEIDLKTKRADGDKKEIPADLEISLPEMNAGVAFNGIIAMDPMEIQGKLEVHADNLASVLALGGGEGSPALMRKLAFSGLVTANEDRFKSEEVDITFGDAKGKGNIEVANLKTQSPVKFEADMAFAGILNLDHLAPAKDKGKEERVEEKVAKGEKLTPSKGGFLPESLSLPFPIDGTLKITADGIQSGGQTYKGVVANISKSASAFDITAKAMDIPGKTAIEGKAALRYASSSQSGEKGMTYADPSVTFAATGTSEQLPTLLRAFAGGGDNKALEIWKAGQFDLTGTVDPSTIKVANSTLKLDQTSIALNASYKPKGSGGRPDIMIDMTTDTVDIDYIQSRLNGQNKQAVQKDAAAKTDVKKALEPVRSFSIPVNLTFDISAQKAVFNAQQITGIRIKGKASGESLNLDVASAQDYMGAAASLRGEVANLKDLSGIDLKFYGKTDNLKSLMQSFKMDTSKLPQTISTAEANIAAKGQADKLVFDAKISALNGELNAAGDMAGLLDKPAFSNLTIGASHPNLVKAIQIMNPTFTGGAGLEQPFAFNAKAVNNGNVYDLSGMKASLGKATINGDLKIDNSGKIPSVTGTVQAGTIPLDDLLGAKNGAAKPGGGGSSGAASGDAASGKWSRTTIETGWMHTINLDLGLSAQSITYGGWNFTKPSTKITLKDGNLTVDNLQSSLFGGNANLSAKVVDPVDPKQPLSLAVQSKMTNVALEPLMFALSGSNRLKATGDVSLDFDVRSTGLSSHALVSDLNGKANVNGKDVILKGFDLAQIGLAFVDTGKPMDRLGSILTGATAGGETRFDTVDGAYDIQQGIVRISSMALDGPAANIKSTGSANLPLWTIDTIHTITLKQAKEAGAFDVAIKGPLSNPGNTFGKGIFNDVLTRRLQQKAVEKLPDLLGKDLGGKLEKLGILPGKQAPAPAPAADPNAAAPAAQPAQQPVPEPQQEPKSLEDQIKDDPAAAMQGILKSLGQ